ncbi:MAG: hypothetical protein P9X24_12615 [Candidatus Hatepunaea meridiana]|nr:hypothetical protein [Candidatus Hatepunaea meridiana]
MKYIHRSIVFITIPAFPIAVERVVSKRLNDRPMVLAQSGNARSRCLSVSAEARNFGIYRGMSLGDVRRRCRDIAVLYPNPSLYQRAVLAIQKIISEYSPLIEPTRAGQNYLDITGTDRLFGSASSVTQLLRQRIHRELRLPAEAGIAVNKLVSRVAAFDASPEGLLEVDRGSEEPFMEPHRISVLPTVDRKLRSQLIELNVTLIQQIKQIELDLLLMALGPVALSLSRQAKGIDPEPVLPPTIPPRIVIAEELSEDTNDKDEILNHINRMVIEGTFRLHQRTRAASELLLNIHYSDGKIVRGSKRLRKHTNSTSIWLKFARELHDNIVTRRVRIRRIELNFMRLSKDTPQLDLWNQSNMGSGSNIKIRSSSYKKLNNEKLDHVMNAMEKIQSRFGKKSLSYGAAA